MKKIQLHQILTIGKQNGEAVHFVECATGVAGKYSNVKRGGRFGCQSPVILFATGIMSLNQVSRLICEI